jgi:hypothetical protein
MGPGVALPPRVLAALPVPALDVVPRTAEGALLLPVPPAMHTGRWLGVNTVAGRCCIIPRVVLCS